MMRDFTIHVKQFLKLVFTHWTKQELDKILFDLIFFTIFYEDLHNYVLTYVWRDL